VQGIEECFCRTYQERLMGGCKEKRRVCMKRIILLFAVSAILVLALAMPALARGPFENRVPDEGSAAATPGLDKAVDAYCSHHRCG
jgi:hypothetical protein